MAAMRVNKAITDTSAAFSTGLTAAIIDFENHTKSAGEAAKAFGLTVVTALQKAVVEMMIVAPIMKALQNTMIGTGTAPGLLRFLWPSMGELGSPGNSMTGAAGDPTAGGTFLTASAAGNVFDQGRIIHTYAMGDIVNSPTMFPMATGAGLMGEAGPEAIMPLQRGPDGRLGVSGGSGGGSTVHIHQGDINIQGIGGADPATVARLQLTLAEFRKNQYSDTVKIVQDASNRGMRLHS